LGGIFEINSHHSQINFEIDYMTISSVNGMFKKFDGYLEFDPEKSKLEKAELFIDAKSIHTNDEKRDHHLQTKDFFDTQKFPKILIDLKSVLIPLNQRMKTEFNFEIKGINKKERLYITNLGSRKDPWGKASHFFLIEGEINRHDYGLNWNRSLDQGGLLVGEKVKLKVRIEAQPSGKKTPFSRYYIPATESIDNMAKARRGELINPISPKIKENQSSLYISQASNKVAVVAKGPEVKDNLGNLIIGFIGFVLTSLICIFLKMKFLKKIKDNNQGSYYFWEIFGDSLVLIIVFLYSVLFYKLLYPN
jgi:polyisoprenoid-binding protein YceI